MSVEDFKACAVRQIGQDAEAWDEVVIQPLIQLGEWFKNQNDTVKWIFGGIAAAGSNAAIAWIARIVGVAAAETLGAILVAFAAGVGIGEGLIVIVECADEL